jgi:RNA 3'-terminal phosphate cyclase (ATP)
MSHLVTLDGSRGEGGGQILRSALALSLSSGRPFRIHQIRAGRSKPGLLRQHLACVHAAQAVGAAEVDGATLGSTEVTFRPQACLAGHHHVQVGSAGSTSLVVQALLPALLYADAASEIVVEGGTHAKYAPPFEFLRDAWLLQLQRLGAGVDAEIERHGFFPAGGGRIRVRITPTTTPRPLFLTERGARVSVRADALVSKLPNEVGARELQVVAKRLSWRPKDLTVQEIRDSIGPGNVLLLTITHEHVTEVVSGFGALGIRAEDVARRACQEARHWMATDVPVGPHLADQLMVPLALGAGGTFRTGLLSRHAQTNLETIRAFLDVPIEVTRLGEDPKGAVEVRIGTG